MVRELKAILAGMDVIVGGYSAAQMHLKEMEKVEEPRACKECGRTMQEGYCIEGGMGYYCSNKCLLKNMTWNEYLELYDEGRGDSYYTEWEE